MKVVLSIPTMTHEVPAKMLTVVSEMVKSGIDLGIEVSGSSILEDVRNRLINHLDGKDYDYMLWMDSDVIAPAEDLIRMISRGKDVIVAPVRKKADPNMVETLISGPKGKDGELHIIEKAATALFCMSKKAVDSVLGYCKENDLWYDGGDGKKIWDVFTFPRQEHRLIGEDIYLCDLLRHLGFTIYCDPTVVTEHIGRMSWKYDGKGFGE